MCKNPIPPKRVRNQLSEQAVAKKRSGNKSIQNSQANKRNQERCCRFKKSKRADCVEQVECSLIVEATESTPIELKNTAEIMEVKRTCGIATAKRQAIAPAEKSMMVAAKPQLETTFANPVEAKTGKAVEESWVVAFGQVPQTGASARYASLSQPQRCRNAARIKRERKKPKRNTRASENEHKTGN